MKIVLYFPILHLEKLLYQMLRNEFMSSLFSVYDTVVKPMLMCNDAMSVMPFFGDEYKSMVFMYLFRIK